MQEPHRAIVIQSPHAGRSMLLSQALTLLEQAGVEVANVLSIAALDSLPPQGAVWQEQGMTLAIAAGGDGVVGGVITHLAACRLPLGILPLGTANDIARSLRIPQTLPHAVEVIAQGHTRPIDIGVARPAGQAPHQAQQEPTRTSKTPQKQGCFAHALTVGLNVQFARIATNVATRQRFGRLAYPVAALEAVRTDEALEVGLHFDRLFFPPAHRFGHRPTAAKPAPLDAVAALHCRAFQVMVVNTPLFDGRWQFAIPAASFSDRLLDIVVIEKREIGDLNRQLAYFFHQRGHPSEQSAKTHAAYPTRHPAELSGIPGIHHLQARALIHWMRPSMGRCAVRHQCKFRSRMTSCRSWCQLWQEPIHSQQDREERNVCTGIMIRRARGARCRAEIEAGGSPPAGRDRGGGIWRPTRCDSRNGPQELRVRVPPY